MAIAIEGPARGFKICVVGMHSVGKTAIVRRFVAGDYANAPLPTIQPALNQKVLLLGKRAVRLSVWDTAGQEKYRAIVPSFLRDAHAVIVVFDITQNESWELAREWVQNEMANLSGDPVVLVCGNKCDLQWTVDVTEEDVREFCERNAVRFFVTSALLGKGVDDMFRAIGGWMLQHFVDALPVSQLDHPAAEPKGGCC